MNLSLPKDIEAAIQAYRAQRREETGKVLQVNTSRYFDRIIGEITC